MIRLLVACSVVALFAAGFFIGQYPAETAGESTAPIETPLPTIRLISADSEEVDVSSAPVAAKQETRPEITIQNELPSQADSTTSSLISEPPAKPEVSVNETALFIANEKLLRELEHQLLNVSRLRDRVADLEWETLNLQSELLDSEIELAKSESELQNTLDAQPTIYNITNVPVGGSVITRPPPAPVNNQVVNRGQEQPSPPTQPSSGTTFFGPAPDRYENLINPSAPEPQDQSQIQSK